MLTSFRKRFSISDESLSIEAAEEVANVLFCLLDVLYESALSKRRLFNISDCSMRMPQ
jgi:hypothetical protein